MSARPISMGVPQSDSASVVRDTDRISLASVVDSPRPDDLPASDLQSCRSLLKRVAVREQLRRAVRLQELLLFLGNRSLDGPCDRLHEQEIGASVFKRPKSYDTSADNIVRSSVSDLRRRIDAYFKAEGRAEPLILEIPRGSYLPVFRVRSPEDAEPVRRSTLPAPAAEHASAGVVPEQRRSLPIVPGLMLSALAAALLVAVYFAFQYRALHRSVFVLHSEPSVEQFWTGFLSAAPNTDIVTSDASIGLAQAISHRTFSLSEYLNRSYVAELQADAMSTDRRDDLNHILNWNLANPDEAQLAQRMLAVDPLRKKLHFYNARVYMPDLAQQDNVILIGARRSNPWNELYDSRLNFIIQFDSPRVVNRAPQAGESGVYVQSGTTDYSVIAYMPKQNQPGSILLIEGTNAEATEAAGDFLLNENQLSDFKKMLHVSRLPYFQVLLRVSSVRGTPLVSTVVAYRTNHGDSNP